MLATFKPKQLAVPVPSVSLGEAGNPLPARPKTQAPQPAKHFIKVSDGFFYLSDVSEGDHEGSEGWDSNRGAKDDEERVTQTAFLECPPDLDHLDMDESSGCLHMGPPCKHRILDVPYRGE